ncbi:hypothetical protein A0H81_14039 [Grifola frondosa]|uniref:Uncharacterized protein n=1 Tax=Grifola frondosa TaxID=5627 RepID=A0A1C7LPR7_GRIFR|nr:hypothetical protein A0H81_14039 [Grifola frondosa]
MEDAAFKKRQNIMGWVISFHAVRCDASYYIQWSRFIDIRQDSAHAIYAISASISAVPRHSAFTYDSHRSQLQPVPPGTGYPVVDSRILAAWDI